MRETVPGDIVPARDAIRLINEGDVDLTPPIEIPAVPREALPEHISEEERMWLRKEIFRLRKERNAIILAHNYMPKDVQDVADEGCVGDSLHLAEIGSKSNADVLLEASVLFMNEILAIMKKPHQTVLAPDRGALCSLAAHADAEKILAWRRDHPKGIVISYVNTYIDVKAESDYVCASANSPKVVRYVLEHSSSDQPILFLPDVYLGYYAARLVEKLGYSLDRLWLMMGACHVHDSIRPHHVAEEQKKHPNAAVVIHPECGCTSACMNQLDQGKALGRLMQFRSTKGMIDFLKETPEREIIVATEVGNLVPMAKAAPEKILIPANREAVCSFMKQNTLRKVYESLRDMKHVITVDPELARRARIPIERMLAIR